MISLIPLPPHSAAAVWSRVKDGIAKALEESHGEVTLEQTFGYLMNGNWLLWIGMVDGELRGATITEMLTSSKGVWLNVLFTYSDAPLKCRLMQHCISFLEGHAKSLGFRGVKMLSSRPGFERIAESLGMVPRFVEYVNDFNAAGE